MEILGGHSATSRSYSLHSRFQTALATLLLTAGASKPAPFITGFLFAPLLFLEFVVLLVVLIRHPSRLWRLITLTPTELRLPDPKWRRVPLCDITGIALARYSSIRGSKKGSWAPIFWRTDGSHAFVSGLGFFTSKADPTGTKPAAMVLHIYRSVAAVQGLAGPLSTVAQQKHADFSRFGTLDRVWDPTAV
jgi:hypothetical protein